MKFENLILIIIFAVYIVSFILKKVRAASKAAKKETARGRPGWKEKLDKFSSQVRQETDAVKQEDSKEETFWEQLLPREDDEPEPVLEEATIKEVEPVRKEISPEKSAQFTEKTSSPKIKPAPLKDVAERLEPAVYGKEILPENLEYGIHDLRKAVIWSEILAPPLALRDK
jgi:flagellar biosynthesis GTPase FlhF